MNWKRFGRKRAWSNLKYYIGISLEELRNYTKKSITVFNVPAGIRTEYLPNTCIERYVQTSRFDNEVYYTFYSAGYNIYCGNKFKTCAEGCNSTISFL
jgi:hypothetical protein